MSQHNDFAMLTSMFMILACIAGAVWISNLIDAKDELKGALAQQQNTTLEMNTTIANLSQDLAQQIEANQALATENSALSQKASLRGAVNPTYAELLAFISSDTTDRNSFSNSFDCTEFSNTFIKSFATKGYFACTTELNFATSDGIFSGHILVAVQTSDNGLIYVEPQNDLWFPASELKLGDNYCSILGCDLKYDKISKISSCFSLIN
jgi:hypothetical protein